MKEKIKHIFTSIMDNAGLRFILILALSVILIYVFPHKVDNLEPYYYASQIVVAVFIAIAGIAALRQYSTTSNNNQKTFEDLRVQRAIELTAFYKDNILRYYPAIRYVFDRCGLLEIITSISPSQMVSFDTEEMSRLLTRSQLEKIKKTQTRKEFVQAVIEADEMYQLGLDPNKQVHITTENDGKKKVETSVNAARIVTGFISYVRDDTLNNLEYFAMAFTHNTADESVIYQSIHQSYCEVVETMYYFIAKFNTSTTDKYYTNVISLYKTWKEKSLEQEKQRKEVENGSIRKGTVVR